MTNNQHNNPSKGQPARPGTEQEQNKARTDANRDSAQRDTGKPSSTGSRSDNR